MAVYVMWFPQTALEFTHHGKKSALPSLLIRYDKIDVYI